MQRQQPSDQISDVALIDLHLAHEQMAVQTLKIERRLTDRQSNEVLLAVQRRLRETRPEERHMTRQIRRIINLTAQDAADQVKAAKKSIKKAGIQ